MKPCTLPYSAEASTPLTQAMFSWPHTLGTVGPFEHVLVVPVYGHAFDKQLTPFEHRLRMCQLAFEALQFVEVSPIEAISNAPTTRCTRCKRSNGLIPTGYCGLPWERTCSPRLINGMLSTK